MSGSVSMIDGHIDEVLKPCPFCGGEAKLKHGKPWQQNEGKRFAFVQCRVCESKTKTYFQYPYEAWKDVDRYAIEAWNRRADK